MVLGPFAETKGPRPPGRNPAILLSSGFLSETTLDCAKKNRHIQGNRFVINRKPRHALVGIVVLLLLSLVPQLALAQIELQYQNRGDRHEGIKPKPVKGTDLELISVLVDYQEPTTIFPDQLKMKFFLENDHPIFITVRELDYRHYYWMDEITPAQPWKVGEFNTFAWSTKTVLKTLDRNLNLYDLGILARMETKDPSRNEHIAPVIFYHSNEPTVTQGYLFTLKPNENARLSVSIVNANDSTTIWKQVYRRKVAGRPFTVKWDASNSPEGPYRFVVKGFSLSTNQPLNQTVRFYHHPTIQ
jgi:hypothetical protein